MIFIIIQYYEIYIIIQYYTILPGQMIAFSSDSYFMEVFSDIVIQERRFQLVYFPIEIHSTFDLYMHNFRNSLRKSYTFNLN